MSLNNFGDSRMTERCVYCGGFPDTKEHTPSKVFFDKPYPNDMFVVGACKKCNQGFSLDEEYIACLIECARIGTTSPEKLERETVSKILSHSPKLGERIAQGITNQNGQTIFAVEEHRAERVMLKIAQSLALFEANEVFREEPEVFDIFPLHLLNSEKLEYFEEPVGEGQVSVWPEVGSRAMQRLLIADTSVNHNGWVVLQEERFRFRVDVEASISIRMVFSEYLACLIRWV